MIEQTKLSEIIERLLAKTENGDLQWEETSSSGEYLCALAESVIVIERQHDINDGQEIIFLAIKNAEGRELERKSDLDFPSDPNAFNKMSLLWNLARSNALGTDKVLNNLLDALED